MQTTRRIIAAAMAGFTALVCPAAETWLIPERFEVTPGATLQLDLIETAPRPAEDPAGLLMGTDRVDYAFFRLGPDSSAIRRFEPKLGGMNFSVQPQRPGWSRW